MREGGQVEEEEEEESLRRSRRRRRQPPACRALRHGHRLQPARRLRTTVVLEGHPHVLRIGALHLGMVFVFRIPMWPSAKGIGFFTRVPVAACRRYSQNPW